MNYAGVIKQVSTGGVAVPKVADLTLPPTQEILIGREPSCELPLDPTRYTVVSRRHVKIVPKNGDWELVDLGSANGTYLNGQQLTGSQLLKSGDRFTLGQDGPEFTFELQPITAGTQVSPPPDIAPVPETKLTFTQLFPIAGTGKDLRKKAYLIPGILTVIFVVLLFGAIGTDSAFNFLLATYIAGLGYYCIYQMCGKVKPWWLLFGSVLFTGIILSSPFLSLFILVFRGILPGQIPNGDPGFLPLFIAMFFGAGLMEELIKALPIFLAYFVGTKLKSPKREKIGVWEPLDGILIGTASAVGFTLLETLFQYVPDTVNAVSQQQGNGVGELMGLQLLIPRILGSIAGHLAYSGYFGYFIGLSVLKPKNRWQILGIGYLTAATLHALWNTVGSYSGLLLAVVGMISYAFLTAAILKAREISPNRADNFATRLNQ